MGAPSSSSTTQLSELPAGVLCKILQRVSQQQRLSVCARVCSAWRSAAAQATVHIDCTISQAVAETLLAWLEQHGRQVESIELRFDYRSRFFSPKLLLTLPWALLSRLQSLSLTNIALPAISRSNSSAAVAAAGSLSPLGGGTGGSSGGGQTITPLLPHLKQLKLSGCVLHSPDCLVQLASSPGLSSLVAESCDFTTDVRQQEVCAALGTLLQRLPQLVVLRLPNAWRTGALCVSGAVAKHVAAMRSLQDLQLSVLEGDCMADLPGSLTRLQLQDRRREHALRVAQPTLPSWLQQLTSLQHLQLVACSWFPAALASIPQLQHLHLEACITLPYAPGNDNAALLGALQQLTRLQHLHLKYMRLDVDRRPQQWSALTASTQLTHLAVVDYGPQPLPPGAAQHMFASRQLPHLQTLQLDAMCEGDDGVDPNLEQEGDWCLVSQDLRSIISCCPQLQSLNVAGTVRADAVVSVLLQLPASCSSLTIGGDAFADAAVPVVAQLTNLHELAWLYSLDLTDLGLQQLTALQGLDKLRVLCCKGVSSGIIQAAGGDEDFPFLELALSSAQGPVWEQLQTICEPSAQSAMASLQLAEREAQPTDSQAQAQQLAEREAPQLADREGRCICF